MGSGGPHSASAVTKSLLRQLCLPNQRVSPRLVDVYENSQSDSDRRLELADLFEALKEVSWNIRSSVLIIIDALDEPNMIDQDNFARILDSLQNPSWKTLITSRSDQHILPIVHERCLCFHITDSNVENDIRYFVDNAIRTDAATDRILSRHPATRSEVIDTLTTRSKGM